MSFWCIEFKLVNGQVRYLARGKMVREWRNATSYSAPSNAKQALAQFYNRQGNIPVGERDPNFALIQSDWMRRWTKDGPVEP